VPYKLPNAGSQRRNDDDFYPHEKRRAGVEVLP